MDSEEAKKFSGQILEKVMEMGLKHELQRLERSFHNLRPERQRLVVDLVMRLGHALVEAEKESRHCTAYCRTVMGDVIMGDYERATEFAKDLRSDPGFLGLPEDNHLKPFFSILGELEDELESERARKH